MYKMYTLSYYLCKLFILKCQLHVVIVDLNSKILHNFQCPLCYISASSSNATTSSGKSDSYVLQL